MKEGEIVETGTHFDLLKRNREYTYIQIAKSLVSVKGNYYNMQNDTIYKFTCVESVYLAQNWQSKYF